MVSSTMSNEYDNFFIFYFFILIVNSKVIHDNKFIIFANNLDDYITSNYNSVIFLLVNYS